MDIIIKKVRLPGRSDIVDVAIKNGIIHDISADIDMPSKKLIEGGGRVLVPAFVDSHIHLDKALIAGRKPNLSGTLSEAIAVTAELKPTFTKEDIAKRAEKALLSMVRHGSLHIRTHSEFDPEQGFTGFETILSLREKYKELVDIQVVAFPQEGIFKAPGTAEMMAEAMKMGADVVGAIPYNDIDANKHIDFAFELAKKYHKPLDFHQDFADDAGAISIEYLCDKTIAEGFTGKVSVGHLTALGALEPSRLEPLAEKIAKAGISVMCLPATDLHLGGRKDTYNVRRTLTPVRALRDAGVNVCLATNNISNAFTPYGNGDLIQIAMLAIPAAHLGGAADSPTVLPMITANPAKALGLTGYGVQTGCKANLVLLDTYSIEDAIIDIPQRLAIIRNGAVILETSINTIKTF